MNRRNFLRLSILAGIAASMPAPVVKYILEPIANRVVGKSFIVDFATTTLTYIGTDNYLDLDELIKFVRELPGSHKIGKFNLEPFDTWVFSGGWRIRLDAVEAFAKNGFRAIGNDENGDFAVVGNFVEYGDISGNVYFNQEGEVQ